jgi:hypothetical protein
LAGGVSAAEFPSAEISNGLITAKLYLPDPVNGYYRGTRFDWSGNMPSLKTKNHEYFGQWFEKHDPQLHDAIMGPVEEFKTNNAGLGYDEATAGGTFVRIGVGVVRKPDEKGYQNFKTYEILDPGKWLVKAEKNRIRFTHILQGPDGYAYRYTKWMVLVKGKNTLRIEHTLENIGRKPIRTQQYNHNFFVIDGQPTGPESVVQFPFDLQATRPFANALAESRGKEIRYTAELQKGQSTYGEFAGGPAYDVRLENRKAKAGVHITGDVPIAKLVYWSIRTTFCPEPYIDLSVDPGKKTRWTYTYDFYDLP